MTHLTLSDVSRIAQLSQLEVSEEHFSKNLEQLNNIFALVEKMRTIDTTGLDPLYHPIAFEQELALRLREDKITEIDQHEKYQECAPSVENGLYLVPKVIE